MPTLRAQRDQIAFSQTELAAAAGTSASTLRRLERGGRSSPALVARLTTFFDEERARQDAWVE
jgi:transcriptional regulator with XRE-family HTH domain